MANTPSNPEPQESGQTWRQVAAFAAILVVVLSLLNAAAGRFLPEVPGSHEAGRNPFHFRGFPAFVEGLDASQTPRNLVLLSNSQGFAAEYPEGFSYPVLLETALNETAGDGMWRVHNWSVTGITSMEYMAFAARLQASPPDVLLACMGYADFKGRNADQGFSHCRSDAPQLLAGRAWTVPPSSFWKRHGAGHMDDVLTVLARAHTPALRYPEYAWSALNQRYPGMMPLFYAPGLRYHPWVLPIKPTWPKPSIRRPPPPEAESDYYLYDDRSTRMLEELVATLHHIDGSRLVLVACPGNESTTGPRYGYHQRFRDELGALAEPAGTAFYDMSHALPPGDYLNSIHFNKSGHRRFAEQLAAALQPILPPPPPDAL